MAKYYLVQELKKEFIPINFTLIPVFSNLNLNDLKDIITFTSSFIDEDDLKNELLHYGLMDIDNINKKLKTIYNYNHKTKTLMYGLTYRDDLRFFNEKYLKSYLKNNKDNLDLLETLCNHYRNSYNQGNNIQSIRNNILFVKGYNSDVYNDVYKDDFTEMNKEFDSVINNFVEREIYRYDVDLKMRKLQYKKLRDLAMFLVYQDKKGNRFEETLEKEIRIDKNEIKIKTKKKQIDGQLTFEDMGWI